MLCCIIAAAFIVRYVARAGTLKRYLGFGSDPEPEPFGWDEYCELDEFDS
ncbi:MAG: hypothetical protein LBS90_06000 [Oscillospiraceae bacterium]|jgi:hypothetical protein|nr:hypothetical protein [Oscillospiraceae bacterium]